MGARPKVVLDTNVIISALGWNGPERRVYEMCLQGWLELCLCPAILEELLRVMEYPKFKFPQRHKVALLQDLIRIATLSEPDSVPNIIQEDQADNHILACAVGAKADFILTGDKHLLHLSRYGAISICTAAGFLKLNTLR